MHEFGCETSALGADPPNPWMVEVQPLVQVPHDRAYRQDGPSVPVFFRVSMVALRVSSVAISTQ